MFGLSSKDRELDEHILPMPIKLLALTLSIGLVVYYFGCAHPAIIASKVAPNKEAFGCYFSRGQPDIIIDENGISIPDQSVDPIPFDLHLGGGGRQSYIVLSEPLNTSLKDKGLQFSVGKDEGVWRFKVLTQSGGTYLPAVNDHPITSLYIVSTDHVHVKYRRFPLSKC